jgi:ATP-binding cassette subfamily F protein 3
MEELATVAGLEVSQGQLRTLLAAFLFGGEEAFKRVSVLSGGERSRLALCKLLLSAPNLLLLDEPTNHLDIASRDVLERALEAYRGTLVIATHDRRLMNRLATRVLALEAGEWHLYAGNYDDWCRLSAQQPGQEAAQPPAAPTPEAKPARGRRAEREFKVAEAQWRQHRSRRTAPLKARLGELLGRIEAAESELAALESELARPETYADHGQARDLHTRQRELKSELERGLIPAWEQAAGELEQLEAEIERERPRIPEPD